MTYNPQYAASVIDDELPLCSRHFKLVEVFDQKFFLATLLFEVEVTVVVWRRRPGSENQQSAVYYEVELPPVVATTSSLPTFLGARLHLLQPAAHTTKRRRPQWTSDLETVHTCTILHFPRQ